MAAHAYPTHRAAALDALHDFTPRMGRAYGDNRNTDLGPEGLSHVSRLSPAVRHRLLLEDELTAAALAAHGPKAAEKFVQEVFWRTYFKGWLEAHPETWPRYEASRDALHKAWQENAGRREALGKALAGETGIEPFDAWTRELRETGYLHNHARMWFASIWIFTLRLPWELGADVFMQHLLDADPASNTLSWRWVGGLHTKGKHYLARAGNIAKFTDGRFYPRYQLNNDAEPLAEQDPPSRKTLSLTEPVTVGTTDAVLLTDDDLHFESLLGGVMPVGLALIDASAGRSAAPLSEVVQSYIAAVFAHRAEDAAAALGLDPLRLRSDSDDFAAALVAWVTSTGATRVVMPYAPVGPGRAAAEAARKALAAVGVELVYFLRETDRLTWPHADRGFFRVKSVIPDIVRELGLEAGPEVAAAAR